ncbi:hypothetical protein IQ238_27620 [Pleurocapsales cyanobacterium LEGE 06147]|nr:hypothetical protein [Pleurocapsales cyanobacterium LEGE 06147]
MAILLSWLSHSLVLLLACASSSFTMVEAMSPKVAQAAPRGEMYGPSYDSGGVLLPDWERFTFRLMPAASRSGSIDLSVLVGTLGYDPSRTWSAGEPIAAIVMLGDLAGATNLPTRSLKSILEAADLSASSLSLADFGVIENQTLKTLVDAVPNLVDLSLGEVAPLYDLVETELGRARASLLRDSALGNLIADDRLADLPLDSLNLAQYRLNSLPGLLDAPLEQFSQWGETLIGAIPGLADLPFANFFTDLGTSGTFALIDVVFGEKEAFRLNTVTGSDRVGFDYPCNQDNCAHIELAGPNWLGATFLQGKQWISGNSQWIPGGSGCLAGKEPTGRHPFGKGFKVVLIDTDEASGLAEFGIYFRFSSFCGQTPYIIGPFPWISQYEEDIIFLGVF